MNEDKVKKDIEEIETINIELDHRVSKLFAENEHLKQTYKQLYDSIKPTCVRSKEQSLKNELRKLKGKSVIACRESVNKPKVIAPIVHKVKLEPLSPKLKNNREAHVDYIRITKENADTLCDIVEQARTLNPLDNVLAYAFMYTKQIQELLVYVSDTCPSSPLKSEKLVAVTPMNKARKVTFAKTRTTSDNNTQTQVEFHQTQTTSKPLVPSRNEKCSTNASRSKSRSETKNNRIMSYKSYIVIPNDVEEDNHDLDVAHMNNDPFFGIPILENDSKASSSSDVIPTGVHTATPNSEHVIKWTKDHPLDNIIAMQEELNEFESLEVWELVPHPDKVMFITLKWIYKVKLDELGGILKNKARLVTRGYRQEEGINFEESFA
ncbi:uncharacterized mitochondrial protein-like protein [Tanacetum coccineum]